MLRNVVEQVGLGEGVLIFVEELPCGLVVSDAVQWVKIGVEQADDVLFVSRELVSPVREGPNDCFLVL